MRFPRGPAGTHCTPRILAYIGSPSVNIFRGKKINGTPGEITNCTQLMMTAEGGGHKKCARISNTDLRPIPLCRTRPENDSLESTGRLFDTWRHPRAPGETQWSFCGSAGMWAKLLGEGNLAINSRCNGQHSQLVGVRHRTPPKMSKQQVHHPTFDR